MTCVAVIIMGIGALLVYETVRSFLARESHALGVNIPVSHLPFGFNTIPRLYPEKGETWRYIADDGTLCRDNVAVNVPVGGTGTFRGYPVRFDARYGGGLTVRVTSRADEIDLGSTGIYAIIIGSDVVPLLDGSVRAVGVAGSDLLTEVEPGDTVTVCVEGRI